jgi:hypothetical protein
VREETIETELREVGCIAFMSEAGMTSPPLHLSTKHHELYTTQGIMLYSKRDRFCHSD